MQAHPVTSVRVGDILLGNNPRRHFDPAEMEELTSSIKAKGVIQPILVRPVEGGYQVIAGGRRLQAAKTAHGDDYQIPVHVRDMDDGEADEAALIENVNRAGMSPGEEAEAAAKVLGRCNGDRDEAARRLGWKREMLDKRLALMNCSDNVRTALIERKILLGHAELLAAAPKDKQDVVLSKLLSAPVLVPVSEFKASLEQHSKLLTAAIFDKKDCAGCQHNSCNQQSLFAEAIKDGHCTNGPCFDGKTQAALQATCEQLKEEFPVVKIVQPGENFTIVKIVAVGELGVGEDQAKACRGCEKFGAAVSNVPGKIGNVYREQCFDPVCNSNKVAERIKAEQEAKKQEAKQAPEEKSTGAKTATPPVKEKAEKPTPSVQDSQRVKDYRAKVWREVFRKEVFADADRSLTVLLALCMTGNARHISTSKLGQAFEKLTGQSKSLDIAEMSKMIAESQQDVRDTLLKALAPSVEGELEERNIVRILTYLNADLAQHWKLNADYLGLLTKSEIEVVADEIGLKTHMGEKEFSKLMGGKKDEIIKGLLNVEGFVYEGKVPKALSYHKA